MEEAWWGEVAGAESSGGVSGKRLRENDNIEAEALAKRHHSGSRGLDDADEDSTRGDFGIFFFCTCFVLYMQDQIIELFSDIYSFSVVSGMVWMVGCLFYLHAVHERGWNGCSEYLGVMTNADEA